MEDKITKKDEIKIAYMEKFGSLPSIPMMQCSGNDDPKYIKMLLYAIAKGRAVKPKDYDKFFPIKPGMDY
jgi:hypothetical protein